MSHSYKGNKIYRKHYIKFNQIQLILYKFIIEYKFNL